MPYGKRLRTAYTILIVSQTLKTHRFSPCFARAVYQFIPGDMSTFTRTKQQEQQKQQQQQKVFRKMLISPVLVWYIGLLPYQSFHIAMILFSCPIVVRVWFSYSAEQTPSVI